MSAPASLPARARAFALRHGSRVMPLGLLVGLALPGLAAALRPFLPVVVPLMMGVILLRIDHAAVLATARRARLMVPLFLWLLLLAPLLADWLTRAAGLSPGVRAAIVMMAAASPMMTAPAFARLMGLDPSLALVGSVVATFVSPFTLPPLALGLAGIRLELSPAEFTLRLTAIVLVPGLVAVLVRRRVGAEAIVARTAALDGATMLMLVLFAVAIMDGVAAALAARPAFVLGTTLVCFVANLGLTALGAVAFAWTGGRTALTAGLLSGNRQMAQLIATLPVGTDPDIFLYFAVAQIPFYLSPWLLWPACRWLLGAPEPAAAAPDPAAPASRPD